MSESRRKGRVVREAFSRHDDGVVVSWKMTKYVVGFCFDRGERNVLLILKERPDWQRGFLNGLGGHVEDGESPAQAMVREFDEETSGRLRGRVVWAPFARLRGEGFELWCFRGAYGEEFSEDLAGQDAPGGEVIQVVAASALHLCRNLVPNLRYLVPMALNHARGIDRAAFFDVVERGVPEEVDRA